MIWTKPGIDIISNLIGQTSRLTNKITILIWVGGHFNCCLLNLGSTNKTNLKAYLIVLCNNISVLQSTKNKCWNIDIDYNIGQFWSGMGLLAQGKKLFCWFCTIYVPEKFKIISEVPLKHSAKSIYWNYRCQIKNIA